MSDISVDLDGLGKIQEALEDKKAEISNPETWYVGTHIEYAIYLEFGTSKMDPKPFFRPALNVLRAKGSDGVIRQNTELDPSTIEDVDTYIRALAFAMEKLIKRIITQKVLVDTGTLRASILAVPNPDVLPDASDFDVPQEGTVDPEAGRQFVQDIQIQV